MDDLNYMHVCNPVARGSQNTCYTRLILGLRHLILSRQKESIIIIYLTAEVQQRKSLRCVCPSSQVFSKV